MNAFLHPRTGASLTNIIHVTAHRYLYFKKMNNLEISEISILQTSISIAEPIDVQIDELGFNIIHMYQLIGIINDEKVPGLGSILNHINGNFF